MSLTPFVIIPNMRYINKLSVRVVITLTVGFLFAGAVTKVNYTCAPNDGAKGCVSFEKAVMHPNDLLNNKQDSLIKFSTTFVVSSLVTFALLSTASMANKKKS